MVPFKFPTATGESAHQWASREAEEQRGRGYRETARSGTLEDYFLQLVSVAQMATSDVDHATVWIVIKGGGPGPGLVVATIDLEPGDQPFDEFVHAVAAKRTNEYEPALVTPVQLPNLGDGVRVTRRDFDDERQLYMTVFYIFRVYGADLLLTSQSINPSGLDEAFPLFEQLLAGVAIEAD